MYQWFHHFFLLLWSAVQSFYRHQCLERPEREPITLGSLPLEILQDILVQLDSSTLLSLRTTCKYLSHAVESRPIWYAIVREIEVKTGSRIEEELQDYSTEELKAWCLRRLRAIKSWNLPHKIPFRLPSNKYTLKGKAFDFFELLPGGHWLLASTEEGFVYCIDLDSSSRKLRQFIDLKDTNKFRLYSYWINHQKSRLSFRLTITTSSAQIKIYQVDLVGHGGEAGLRAKRVATICTDGQGFRRVPSSNDKFYIEEFTTRERNTRLLRLFQYIDGKRYDQAKPIVTVPISTDVGYMKFISTTRLLVHTNELNIYDIVIPDGSTGHSSTMIKVHTIPLVASLHFKYSPTYILPFTSRLVVFNGLEVNGISIPHDDPSRYTVTKLGDYKLFHSSGFACGLRTALVMTLGGPDLLSFSWDEDGSGVGFEVTRFRKGWSGMNGDVGIWLREDIGRIVFENFNNSTLYRRTLFVKDITESKIPPANIMSV